MSLAHRLLTLAFASAALAPMSTLAVVHTYSLTGSGAGITTTTGTDAAGNYSTGHISLLNPGTNSNNVPAFTLSVGDVVQMTVTLDAPITIPDSITRASIASILSNNLPFNVAFYESTVTFFRLGVLVQPFSGQGNFGNYVLSSGHLAFGGIANSATPSFTFDRVAIVATMDHFFPALPSITVGAGQTELQFTSYAPVPELASSVTIVLGLAGLFAFVARRRRNGAHPPCAERPSGAA